MSSLTRRVVGKGIYSKGQYTFGKKGNPTKEYSVWLSMMSRCYNSNFLSKNKTYIGCTVCEEWLDFQIFAKWFHENYKEGYQLDKDLLIKGNKIYSPETCCFVPQQINLLLVNRKNKRGKYPLGVSKDKNKFSAGVVIDGKRRHIKNFNNVEEAFAAYKKAKKENICRVAEEYKDKIPERVYKSLLNYDIDIND